MAFTTSQLDSPFFSVAVGSGSDHPQARIVYKTSTRTSGHPPKSYLAENVWSYVRRHGEVTGTFEWGMPKPLDDGDGSELVSDNFALSYQTDSVGRSLFIGDIVGEQQEISIRSVSDIYECWEPAVKLKYQDGTQVVARKDSKLVAGVMGNKLRLYFVNQANEIVVAVRRESSEEPGTYHWTKASEVVATDVMSGSNLAISLDEYQMCNLLYQRQDGSLYLVKFDEVLLFKSKILDGSAVVRQSPLALSTKTANLAFYVRIKDSTPRTYALALPGEMGNCSWPKAIARHTMPNSIGVIDSCDLRFISISNIDGEPVLVQRMLNINWEWVIPTGEIPTAHRYQGQIKQSSSPVMW